MDFEFNKVNQLEIHSALFTSSDVCPTCKKVEVSSLYLEKSASKVPQSYSITLDSVGPTSVFVMKCTCGHSWLNNVLPVYTRPRIKGVWMRNFQPKEKV